MSNKITVEKDPKEVKYTVRVNGMGVFVCKTVYVALSVATAISLSFAAADVEIDDSQLKELL